MYLQREHIAYASFLEAWGDDGALHHRRMANELKDTLNRELWREDLGYHIALNTSTREAIEAKTYVIALPLWAGLVNKSQAEAIAHTLASSDMLSKVGLRSTSSDDPRYSNAATIVPYSNWRGPMWVNANALAAYGLNRYGYRTLALEIAHRVTAALADDLRAAGTWHEAYSTDDGKPLAAKGFLSWDTLSAELVDNLLAGRDPLSLDKPNLFAERDPLNNIASWSPIRELAVVIGKSGAPCPTGTSRIGAGAGWDSDFNDGAGGDYVYLCMSTKGAKPPITGLLAVHANTTSGAVCPTNYTKLAGNMQSKSRSKGVAFLCVSRSNATDGKQPLGVLQGVLASSGCGAMHAVNDSRAVSTPFKFDAAGVGRAAMRRSRAAAMPTRPAAFYRSHYVGDGGGEQAARRVLP